MQKIIEKINVFSVLVTVLAFFLGWQLGHKDVSLKWENYRFKFNVANQQVPSNLNLDFKLFWDTWNLVSNNYIDKKAIDPQKMFYGAISGMVAAVGDPYTVFLPPEEQKSSKEDLGGSFEGVGMELGFNKEKRLVVIAPLDGTPAKNAGIKPGDLILKINDKDTYNISLPDAVKLIRGEKGTKVDLTIFRDGDKDSRVFTIKRDTIIVKSVQLDFKNSITGKKIAVIKLTRFGERTETEWLDVVSQINNAKASGIILDVRNNPGGFLDAAVFISSEFLSSGNVVLQQNAKGEVFPFKVNRSGNLLDIPVVVLINKGSASASEIVAGALQDRERAKLVGEKSFGKGTIQETQQLPNNTGIHITVAKWLTPNSRWVNETQGFEPDFKVEMVKDDPSKDPQLDKALELLN